MTEDITSATRPADGGAPTLAPAGETAGLAMVVTGLRSVALDVVELTLEATDGHELPAWEPGAHVDVVLPDDLTRQYSLCGNPEDRHHYRIAVLKELEGRGGSRRIHDEVVVGTRLRVQGPRNHFPLQPSRRYLFIAGGIGVTPLLPMIRAAERTGSEWRLVYGGRTDASMSYLKELRSWDEHVTLWPEDRHGHIDLDGLLGTPDEDTLIYCCGPEPLLAAVEKRCSGWPRGALNVERFSATIGADEEAATAFEVELRQTGATLQVRADQSILDAVTERGVYVPTSCTEGTCGSCETPVLEGEPLHRDVVLSEEERERGETMMVCVSRAKSARLVLDL